MRKFSIQQGMTLVELMISMVIGMFLIMGAITVYSQGRTNYQSNEAIARLQENMRFALDIMEPDIRLAGYWGLHNRGGDVFSTGMVATCDGNNISAWALNTSDGLVAVNNVQAADADEVATNCSTFGDGIVVDTDFLIVRHASGSRKPFDAGTIQVQSALAEAHMFDDGSLHTKYTEFDAEETGTHNVIINAWYISRDSNSMAGVPSLRRRTLKGSDMVDEEVIAGVENLQIQFGIDTDLSGGDGSIDRYVDAEDAALAGNKILAVRIWLLIRSTEEERGFVDGRTYTPLDATLGPIVPDDNFRRIQASKTIFVRNFQREEIF